MSGGDESTQVRVGRYELVRRIGFGGMAEVFLARLTGPADFSKTVVVKRILPQLHANPMMSQMFIEEARIAAATDHDNIAKVYELGRTDDGQYFMVMEYIDGIDLEILQQKAAEQRLRIPTWFAVHVVAQTLEALSYVHNLTDDGGRPRNVVHRDATPSNIFVSHLGQVKLLDFGVAHFAGKSPTTQAGQLKGKIAYMAPEQLRARDVDARADLFSLGVVLWEALTQERLFGHLNEMQAMVAICDEGRPSPSEKVPGLHPRLDAICSRALALERESRYESAEAFQSDLLDVLHELRPPVRPRDVRAVLEEVEGRRLPFEATCNNLPELSVEKSFLIPIDDLELDPTEQGPETVELNRDILEQKSRPSARLSSKTPIESAPPPDLDETDSDTVVTVDEAGSPSLECEVFELRALLAEENNAPPTQPLPVNPSPLAAAWVVDEGSDDNTVTSGPTEPPGRLSAAKIVDEHSGDQTVASGPVKDPAAHSASTVFRVRSSASRPAQVLDWENVVHRAHRAAENGEKLEISARGEEFVSLAEFGRLTGQDLDYELEPASNVAVLGQLVQQSLTRVLVRLGIERATGVLTVARPSDGAWFELEIHEGRPCRVISPLSALQLPQMLIANRTLEPRQVAQLCAQSVHERRPLTDLLGPSAADIYSHRPFHAARLASVFGWKEGDFTFNRDFERPNPSHAFADSLLAMLPWLVAESTKADHLAQRLSPFMLRRFLPSPVLRKAQFLFTSAQRDTISKLIDSPLREQVNSPFNEYHSILATAYVLVEGGLVA